MDAVVVAEANCMEPRANANTVIPVPFLTEH